MKQINLWPVNLYELVDTRRLPVHLLREQAAILGQKTQNIVIAEVDVLGHIKDAHIEYSFDIVAPLLGNYTTSIFTITGEMGKLYPITIENLLSLTYVTIVVSTEKELQVAIKEILAHPKLKEIIQGILAHSNNPYC